MEMRREKSQWSTHDGEREREREKTERARRIWRKNIIGSLTHPRQVNTK